MMGGASASIGAVRVRFSVDRDLCLVIRTYGSERVKLAFDANSCIVVVGASAAVAPSPYAPLYVLDENEEYQPLYVMDGNDEYQPLQVLK